MVANEGGHYFTERIGILGKHPTYVLTEAFDLHELHTTGQSSPVLSPTCWYPCCLDPCVWKQLDVQTQGWELM